MPEPFRYVDLNDLKDSVLFDNDLPYPDWRVVGEFIRAKFGEAEWFAAWGEAVGQWLQRLSAALGSQYAVTESPNFFVMSPRPAEGQGALSNLAEQLLAKMRGRLAGLNLGKLYGKHVVLLFEDQDQYYRYVSHFYPEGEAILTAGLFLQGGGYAHIAMHEARFGIENTLAHELAHNCLMTLPLPLWLNEGMAALLKSRTSANRAAARDADLAQEHFGFWNCDNIQAFWQGRAFVDPNSSRLAYSLANIFLALIMEDRLDLARFLSNANYADAGEAAAEKFLGKTLGELAGVFLGPGDWMPKPKPPV